VCFLLLFNCLEITGEISLRSLSNYRKTKDDELFPDLVLELRLEIQSLPKREDRRRHHTYLRDEDYQITGDNAHTHA
jgi:hypothetical protein